MRKDKNKDKKGQESIIGKIIYSSLLFSPLIAIACAVLISTFNMSAKEEAEIHYKYETNEVNNYDDLIVNNVYSFTYDSSNNYNLNAFEFYGKVLNCNRLYVENSSNYMDEFLTENEPNKSEVNILFTSDGTGNISIQFSSPSEFTYFTNIIDFNTSDIAIIDLDIQYLDSSNLDNHTLIDLNFRSSNYNEIKSVETNNVSPQDIFYTAVNKVEDSNLFNWSKNSIVYTTMNATCNQLHITTTFIPMLLSYWLIISVIYFLYDIALMLIWLLHNKIHELQESI